MIGAGRVTMLLDNYYGPDRRVEYEAKLLTDAGLAVRVVAWDRRSPKADSAALETSQQGGMEVVRVRVPAPPGGGASTFRAMTRFAWETWRRRDSVIGDADLLVVHDVYLLPFGRLLAAALRIPFVYDAHEEYAAMEGARYPGWWLWLVTAMEGVLARGARRVVVPGTTRQTRWTRAGFPAPTVLRNLGDHKPPAVGSGQPKWDLAYCGTLADVRRVDVLVDLARARPDLQIAIAGKGRGEGDVELAARELDNLQFLGWLEDSDQVLADARAVYYGLDPRHPYADKACPNNLYQAIRLERPLIFFCGGEIAEVADKHRIGVRCAPTADAVAAAVDEVRRSGDGWEFKPAWGALADPQMTDRYVASIRAAMADSSAQ